MDISCCTNGECAVRSRCFRFRAIWGRRQSLSSFHGGKDCPHFWSLDGESRIVTTDEAEERLKKLET